MEETKPYSTNNDNQELNLINEPVAAYLPNRISLIRQGLQFNSLTRFLSQTGMSRFELATILQVSVRTLQRHEQNTRLSPAISEKLLQLNDLYHLASDVLGSNPRNITDWLRSENAALGAETPLSLLDTYIGLEQVKQILGRMAHGVFS